MLHKQFDFLIIGSGLAGLYAAHEASKYGSVAILTKSKLDVSNSYYAQGGVAAVTNSNDFPRLHIEDTIEAGRGLCDDLPVETLVNEGSERIKELIRLGMKFDTRNGELALGLEGGHHRRRVLHAGGDSTGKELVQFLIKQVKNTPSIKIFEDQTAYEILVNNKICMGAKSYHLSNHSNLLIQAKTSILSSGGAAAIYRRTTNPHTAVGDGIALAFNAGAQIADMEFIQFHPSSFYSEKGNTFLISEAVRGEGAHLLNRKRERFMPQIHKLAELAPRDVVARAIFNQMKKNNDKYVLLSLQHLNSNKLKKRFPSIYQKCKQAGCNFLHEIPVAPAAHYMVGGVKTDLHAQTNISGLYACGELASTGVMGANRLASNSLLECLVFGKRAIKHSVENKKDHAEICHSHTEIHANDNMAGLFTKHAKQISNEMNNKLGIVRTAQHMNEVLQLISQFEKSFPFQENEYYSIQMKNLLCVCKLITTAALAREESRGGHYREDFTTERKQFLAHSIQQQNKELRFVPVEKTNQTLQ